MARAKRTKTKPALKSKSKRRKSNAKLGYGQMNKNISTMRKIEKANQEEKGKI